MAARNLTHGTLVIRDGTGSPNTLTIPVMEGNLQFTERREAHTVLNRGVLREFTVGAQEPVSISFDVTFEEWTGKSSGNPSVPDALKQRGRASGWASTVNSGPYCVDLRFTMSNPETTGGQNEQLDFADFHADEIAFAEGEDYNRLTVTGKALVTAPTATRA